MVNLLFELLYENESLEESHQIVKIEYACYFQFISLDTLPTKGSLIIGNPKYSVRESEIIMDGERSSEPTRAIGIDLMKIGQLHFAEIEV